MPFQEGSRGATLMRSSAGRLWLPWRLGLFVVLFVFFLVPLSFIGLWLGGSSNPSPLPWQNTMVLLGAAWLASWFLMERVEGLPVSALGLLPDRSALQQATSGLAVGVALIGVALAGLAAAGWLGWTVEPGVQAHRIVGATLRVSGTLATAAMGEELLFRGYPFQAMAERTGGAVAIALTAAVFGLAHVTNPNVGAIPLANIFLAGLVLGVAYWRTYSLWFVGGLHLGWNWCMGVAVDLPVSGIKLSMPGWDSVLRGPVVWTGGDFGPEGGLAVSLAALAGLVWLTRTKRLHRSLAVRSLGPLPDRRSRNS